MNEELTEHLGHEKHQAPSDRDGGNIRNGTRAKTVLTEATAHVTIEVPRDRDGTFEPQIVKKRQRRLTGVEEIVLSLYAKGLMTGEISAHFAQIRGAKVSKETVLPPIARPPCPSLIASLLVARSGPRSFGRLALPRPRPYSRSFEPP